MWMWENRKQKTPRDGFEPSLKEPESFVLPLDDLGIIKLFKQILALENLFTIASVWQLFFYYIDLRHWKEDEFLLNKGSRFLVTGLDKENGFINVKYLGD